MKGGEKEGARNILLVPLGWGTVTSPAMLKLTLWLFYMTKTPQNRWVGSLALLGTLWCASQMWNTHDPIQEFFHRKGGLNLIGQIELTVVVALDN